MHDEPRHKLRELILNYGQSLCTDSRRCEALLKDVCGQYRKEIFVLTTALKNRVADELLKNSAGVPPTLLSARLIKRLEDDAALNSEAAHWAVESWMLALGVIAQPLPRSNTTPTPQIVQPSIAAVSTTLMGGCYQDNNDGTVTDVKTNLQWMRFSLGQEWKNGTCIGDAKKYTWEEAKQAAELLNKNGGYAGYQGWRLPTIEELKSLVYCSSGQPKTWNDTGEGCEGNYAQPTIDSEAFPNTPTSWFWSGSPNAGISYCAWYVDFDFGDADDDGYRYNYLCIRLVRGGQEIVQPSIAAVSTTLMGGRYRDNNDGTVTDVKTGLQWMRFSLGQEWKNGTCVGEAKRYTWDEAKKVAELINKHGGYAGYQDWRLPTIDELKSLVYCSSGKPKIWNDTGNPCEGNYAQPTLDLRAFPNTPSSWFWSGSPHADYSDYAWDVNFGSGSDDDDYRYDGLHVRLVRTGK